VTIGWRAASDIPSLRRWSRREMFLAGALFTLAASAWTLTHLMGTPEMRMAILTGAEPMGDMMPVGLVGAALFQVTWIVMMAAMMMLPAWCHSRSG
jgi:predicted small integral membrane protein